MWKFKRKTSPKVLNKYQSEKSKTWKRVSVIDKKRIMDAINSSFANFDTRFTNICFFTELKIKFGSGENTNSIEHFKPKSQFPELTFSWNNLYISHKDWNMVKNMNIDSNFRIPKKTWDEWSEIVEKNHEYFTYQKIAKGIVIKPKDSLENKQKEKVAEFIRLFRLNSFNLGNETLVEKRFREIEEMKIKGIKHENFPSLLAWLELD